MLLGIALTIEIVFLLVGLLRGGMLNWFFSAISGIVVLLSIAASNGNIEYVTSAGVTSVNSGATFFLIPILLTIIAFMGMVTRR
jgi:hypothetical protein